MEGCGYRDRHKEFEALGVKIIAVGGDDPATNLAWAQKQAFPFEVWTDQDRVLAKALGASDGQPGRFSRVTRVIDAEGRVLLEYDVGLSIPTHPQDVLEDCQALFGGGPTP